MLNRFITRTSALAGLLMLSSVTFAQLPNPTYGFPGGIASNVTAVGNTFDVYLERDSGIVGEWRLLSRL